MDLEGSPNLEGSDATARSSCVGVWQEWLCRDNYPCKEFRWKWGQLWKMKWSRGLGIAIPERPHTKNRNPPGGRVSGDVRGNPHHTCTWGLPEVSGAALHAQGTVSYKSAAGGWRPLPRMGINRDHRSNQEALGRIRLTRSKLPRTNLRPLCHKSK